MRPKLRTLAAGLLLSTATTALAQQAPIVLPGAPGAAPRVIDEDEATRLSDTRFSPADVKFMQDMIVHHQQAVDLAALVEGRSNNSDIVAIAGRIDASQADEIAFMREWLAERGQLCTILTTLTRSDSGQAVLRAVYGSLMISLHPRLSGTRLMICGQTWLSLP